MKLKKLHLLLFVLSITTGNVATAQLFIDQATFTIQPGATVTVQGDVTSNTDIQGTGKIILNGSANQNVNMGGFTIPNLEINNTANVTLTGNAIVSGDILFTNGKVLLGANTLTIGSAGTITNPTSTNYIVTNGAGKLVKSALAATAFAYPVGNSLTSYNPVVISNSGTADDVAVRAFTGVLTGGSTGAAFSKEVVNATWDISEAVAGGSNLSVTAAWSGTDELAGFDRARAGISYYITSPAANVGWDLLNSQTADHPGGQVLTGTNPYTFTRTGVTTLGTFAIGTRPVLSPLLVTPKIFLQGAYSAGLMTDFLRAGNLIPTTEPYTGFNLITASLRGSGGGETSAASVVGSGSVTGGSAIVDWVLVQLHDANNGTVVTQRAVLLQRNGNVVETDGLSPVNLAGNAAGNYYISVRHRNHLGVRTAATIALAKTANTNYDFTTGLGQAFAGAVGNNAMATLVAGTTFGLWGGNANGNTNVKYSGPGNDELQLLNSCLSGNKASIISGYLNCDLNMNGSIKYSGPQNDELFLINTVLSGNKAAIITQPTF